MVSKEEAKQALTNIFHFCEEIDNHLPDDEQTGYKMFPDYQLVREYINDSVKYGQWIEDIVNGQKCMWCSNCRNIIYPCSICGYGRNVLTYCHVCGSKNA